MNNLSFTDFKNNETIVKAVLYDFLIIGEAAINIPAKIQSNYPEIPWRIMGDMRNVMAHEYFQVNLKIVWNTAKNNLPNLIVLLEYLIENEGIR
ncbi:HepT-like ribonuclease domain-containing protein [Calothrix sp. NIES-3974]|uniref:HepT-like ribonuclease domain-containing protein n=1 Tax=Calothrix sp. NIES-3974 TaxID=2005462 RepID=UPI000B615342|nr:HepT-like ribonuclease domain-containing protein [Calothrix sp. NIES-3974]BAZ04383.1 hypothetical protein NIES3974_10210 [Calothrix sp. NIES-3974]